MENGWGISTHSAGWYHD